MLPEYPHPPVRPVAPPQGADPPGGPGGGPPPPARRRRALNAALVAALALTVVGLFGALRLRSGGGTGPNPSPDYFDPDRTGIPPYAVVDLPIKSADKAGIGDDEEVFGVSLGGKHRAYRVRACSGTPMVHVVNDLLGDAPLTVAHCDRTSCTKVLTGDRRGEALFVGLGGWRNGRMWIRAGDGIYDHETLQPAVSGFGPFPYKELAFRRTTWKAWREAHPDTDVYTGGGRLYPPRPSGG